MRPGTENRKKTIAAGALGTVAVLCMLYAYNAMFGGSTAPTSTPSTVTRVSSLERAEGASSGSSGAASRTSAAPAMPAGNAAGVGARKMASTSASLDPTLDERAMLRTEHMLYSGSGRNIFSALYTPPPKTPVATHPARPTAPVYAPPPQPVGPPPPPPINLKFFGTATHPDGTRQAFLLQGEDVFLASQGDIVARRYRIVSIAPTSVQVEDMANDNTQSLPLQSN